MPAQKLYRSRTDVVLAGVCGGLAEFFDVDSTIFRIIFVVLALFGGSGVIIYLLLWIIVPQNPSNVAEPASSNAKDFRKEMEKGVEQVMTSVKSNLDGKGRDRASRSRIVFASLLIVIGLLLVTHNFFPRISFNHLWPFVIIILGAWLLMGAQKSSSSDETPENDTNKAEKKKEEAKPQIHDKSNDTRTTK